MADTAAFDYPTMQGASTETLRVNNIPVLISLFRKAIVKGVQTQSAATHHLAWGYLAPGES